MGKKEKIRAEEKMVREKVAQERKNIKGLAGKMMKWISIPVIVVFVVSGFLLLRSVQNTVVDDLAKKELSVTTQAAAYQINNFFENYEQRVTEASANKLYELLFEDTAATGRLEDSGYFADAMAGIQKAAATDPENILASWIADFDSSCLMMSDGFLSEPGWDVTQRPWYQVANTGKPLLTAPYIDVSTGKMVVTAAAPLYNGEGTVIGAAGIDIAMTQLAAIMQSYNLDETVRFMLSDAAGGIVYFPQEELIGKNISEIGLSDNMVGRIMDNQTEFTEFDMNGVKNCGYVAMVGGTDWNITSIQTVAQYRSEFNGLALTIIGVFAVGILIVLLVLRYIAGSIVKPLKALTRTAEEIAQGNMDVQVEITTQDEIGVLGEAITATVERLKNYIRYIEEIGQVLEQIADGDLRFELKCDYVGEFAKLKKGLLHIQNRLTELLRKMNDSAVQVAEGASQIAQSAATIAESSTEQAGSVDKLSRSIADVVELSGQNEANAGEANQNAQTASAFMNDGSRQLTELTQTIEGIQEVSKKINSILETINDIADQTNLLSLNASIEAARAGEAGRGFSVVAGEIGHLATQTTSSSKETGEMIETILGSINDGTEMAKKTSGMMDRVLGSAARASEGIQSISEAIIREKQAMDELEREISQIMAMVENNTAASEESVAASEELAAQASALKQLVAEFKI